MNIQNENCYTTTDFYLSACVIASGHSLIDIVSTQTNKLEFVLDISPEKANKLIQNHWSRTLTIPTRNLIDAIKELKSRMYQK